MHAPRTVRDYRSYNANVMPSGRLAQRGTPASTLASLRRDLVRGRDAARFHHHFDRIVHPVLGVADCGRQVCERAGVRVDPGGIETLLRHECFRPMGWGLALA